MLIRDPYLDARPYGRPVRQGARSLATTLLRAASHALDALAERLSPLATEAPTGSGVVEFYAEAGAPEGALYIDGHLVGHVTGVRRL
jgi:hypothetical protein